MSAPPASSALNPASEAFPSLTAVQINRVRSVGKLRQVAKGEILFDIGDTNVPFFVLLSGSMEIVQSDLRGELLLVKLNPGEFTGEMTMMTGRRGLARGRAAEPGEFLELSGEALRSLVARDAELSQIFMRAFILRRLKMIQENRGNIILLGSQYSANSLRLREFLTRNEYPFAYIDLDKDKDSQEILDRFHVSLDEIPVIICRTRAVLKNPTIPELADCIGLNIAVDQSEIRDLIIVGAGPAGLAAAVYGASEGLNVLVVEAGNPGGQAGSSSMIENYLGFPMGVSGNELAMRAIAQTEKFGAKMMVAHGVSRLDCDKLPYKIILDNGHKLAARSIVIATGAHYNKPDISNLDQFESQGIYYGATHIESQLCENEEIIVIGGGNSAGQAAIFLSQSARKVHVVVRSHRLVDTMSRYLVQRIEENPAIQLHYETEIVALEGDKHLERVTWKDKTTGQAAVRDIRHIFVMAGASPRTEWLRGCLALDDKGFIFTGRDLETSNGNSPWKLPRAPQMLETSLPGVFAVGDVRAGSVKRVASAVGEGAIAIHMVHRALAET